MSTHQECIDYLKYLAKVSKCENKTYCQLLDDYSREFGFNSYYDFRHNWSKLSLDRRWKISSKLTQKYCSVALPDSSLNYYYFTAHNSEEFSYYGHWIGFDKLGQDVREPSSIIEAKQIVDILRERSENSSAVYVIDNNGMQFIHWSCNWLGKAVIVKELAEKFFPSFFNQQRRVCKDVERKLIETSASIRNQKILQQYYDLVNK